jgi:hypothetical protein
MNASDVVVGIALVAAGVICIFLANYQWWELRFEVNERLPDNEKFEPLFWTFFTYEKFRELRNRVLPDSPRPKRALRYAAIGLCLFFSGIGFLLVKANS